MVRLWPIEKHDLLKNYQWANDRELISLAGMNPLPKSALDVERWYESMQANPENLVFAIKTDAGDYLGNIELRDIEYRSGRGELGIILGERSCWGKGYGTDAVVTLCRFAFEELRFHRIYARVLENNERAQRLFSSCGFRKEGVARQDFYAGGCYWDVILFGLLKEEFKSP